MKFFNLKINVLPYGHKVSLPEDSYLNIYQPDDDLIIDGELSCGLSTTIVARNIIITPRGKLSSSADVKITTAEDFTNFGKVSVGGELSLQAVNVSSLNGLNWLTQRFQINALRRNDENCEKSVKTVVTEVNELVAHSLTQIRPIKIL